MFMSKEITTDACTTLMFSTDLLYFLLVWVLWHINPCRLFNAKPYLYTYIKAEAEEYTECVSAER